MSGEAREAEGARERERETRASG
jgi:hypothetical protein